MYLIKQLLLPALTALIIFMPALASGDKKELKKKESPTAIGERDINKGQLNFYSPEKELEMGKRLAASVERRSKFVEDAVVLEFVNRVAQNLVINSDSRTLVRVKVIDAYDINAFALPGGFLYVNRGVIEAADNEAELAGVLAHEIAHIAARHGVERATQEDLMGWLSLPFGLFGGGGGGMMKQAAGAAIPLIFLKFSRGAEREADRLAAQYLWRAGYDPHALITFFEKMKAQEKKAPGSMQKIFRTHPMNEDRIKDTRELLGRFPRKDEYQINSADFIAVKDRPGIKKYKWDILSKDRPSKNDPLGAISKIPKRRKSKTW